MATLDLTAPQTAYQRIRPQIMDLQTENIAELAVRAKSIPDVITLWYGEGDLVTPEFIRDGGQGVARRRRHLLCPGHARPAGADGGALQPISRSCTAGTSRCLARRSRRAACRRSSWRSISSSMPARTWSMSSRNGRISARRSRSPAASRAPSPLDFENGDWRLDLEKLFAACDARTRAIMFSTPSNPLGWTASRDELQALIDFSRRTGIWIISDELYNRLAFEAEAAPSVLQLAEPEDLVMSVNGFSKAWAMTGWRIGWLTHPPSVAKPLGAMTQYLNSGTAAFIQAGARAAIVDGEPFVKEVRERCRAGSRRRLRGARRPQQDRAAEQAQSRDVRDARARRRNGFDARPAGTFSRRRMSGSPQAGSSGRRRRASCACASAAKRQTSRKPAAASRRPSAADPASHRLSFSGEA